jgi:hypothetical protein
MNSIIFRSRGSSVGIATGYGLDDGGVGVRIPAGQEISLLPSSRPTLGSYPMGAGGFSPGVKRPRSEADH